MTDAGSRLLQHVADGRHALVGSLLDLETGANLTEAGKGRDRLAALAAFPDAERVIFPALGEGRARVTVFTDTSCGYCRKLQRELPRLQGEGVTVTYVPFPRSGPGGPACTTMRRVWCSPDRSGAMDIAKGVPIAAGALYPVLGLLLSPMNAAAAMSFSSASVIGNALRLRSADVRGGLQRKAPERRILPHCTAWHLREGSSLRARSGCVGKGEHDCLMADHADDFDLKLELDAASGADIRDAKAATAKPDGEALADACWKGPRFVTKLPAGNDKVRATGHDEMTAAVPATVLETAVSNQWPGAEAAEETPAPRSRPRPGAGSAAAQSRRG